MTADLVEVRLDVDGAADQIRIRAGLAALVADDIRDLIIAADVAAALDFAPREPASPGPSGQSGPSGIPASAPSDASGGSARDLSDLLGRAMATVERVDAVIEGWTRTGPATTHDPVRITVTAGRIVDVTIDPRWLTRADPSGLARELDRALVDARTAYERSRHAATQLTEDLARLLADVKVTLGTLAGSGPR